MTYCKIPIEHMAIIEGALTDILDIRTEQFARLKHLPAENQAILLAHLDGLRETRRTVISARLNPTNGT